MSVRKTGMSIGKASGIGVDADAIIKAFGFTASGVVDELLKVKSMFGYWANRDHRRWIYSESPGLDFTKISTTTVSPAAAQAAEIPLHFLKFPRDFNKLLASGLVPEHKPGPEKATPCYVLSVRAGSATIIAVTSLVAALQARDFGALKRAKQRECHPCGAFLEAAAVEWTSYCELLEAGLNGDLPPRPEYPYTLEM